MALAFEVQNRIDHVLEDSGSGNGAFFRHVPDDKDGNVTALAPLHEASGAFPDLRNAPGRRRDLIDGDGLNRIDDQERRRHRIGARQNLVEISAGENQDVAGADPQAIGTQSDLLRRLLRRHIEDWSLHIGQCSCRL
jgi:hypothetical protein